MDCSPPGFSLHGILQARILVWVAMSSSRGSSQPRDQTWVSCAAGRFFNLLSYQESLWLTIEESKIITQLINRFINIKNTYYLSRWVLEVLNTLPTDTDDFLELILIVWCLSLMRTNTALASWKLETLIISVEHVLNIKPGKLIQGMNVSAIEKLLQAASRSVDIC